MPSTLLLLAYFSFTAICEVGNVVSSTLQREKLRHKKGVGKART
jgi:hypothetical protein